MKTKLWGIIILVLTSMLYLTACDNSTSPGIEDSLDLFTGLELIPEASNTSLIVNKGTDLQSDGYFTVKIEGAAPNNLISNVSTEAWCLEWKKPMRSSNDEHKGVKWYDTSSNEKWKPLNYFFSIRKELQRKDQEITFKEIQAVIWVLAGHMGIAPEFNLDKLPDSELPSDFRTNGIANFNKSKVKEITAIVLSNYASATVERFSAVGETSHDNQDVIVPPPPPPVIDVDTEIYIYFDASGSMNSTLNPLNTMRSTLLKDALLPLYDNDSDAYDSNVTVTSWGTERTFDVLNLSGATPEGNVIVLVFQDEAASNYHAGFTGWDENTTRTSVFDSDMTTFRSRLASFESDYYRGVIFQVTNTAGPWGANFKRLIESVEGGFGNYSGNYGLADRTEIKYIYDVNDGDTAQTYTDLVIDALEDLGFDLTPPSATATL